ncbi:MAG: calcium-binding protein [Acidimicrobiales bacterium]
MRAVVNTMVVVAALALVAVSISLDDPLAAAARATSSQTQTQTQSPLPSRTAGDAARLFAELGAAKDTIDARSLTSLGPNPHLSFTPDRDRTEIVLWRALAQTLVARQADLRQRPGSATYTEREPAGTSGANDTVATGERIRGVGPGPRQSSTVLIRGSLQTVPAPVVAGTATEDDGAIGLANTVVGARDGVVRWAGRIGDGPHAATGDADFFALGQVTRGETIIVATDTTGVTRAVDTVVALWTSSGELIELIDDSGGTRDSYLEVTAPATDTYFASVTGCCDIPGDPFDPTSGQGRASTGRYEIDFRIGGTGGLGDIDVFLVDLDPGDVVVAAAAGSAAQLELVDPRGRKVMGSAQNLSFAYPATSPLRHSGAIGLDHVVADQGRHAVIVSGSVGGRYRLQLQVLRPGPTAARNDRTQILFLDFDGDVLDTRPLGGSDPAATVSPLSRWLGRWGLEPGAENTVIDATIASFREDLERDLSERGPNGDRDISGRGGEFDIVVLNSRDHPDPGRNPNVSRVIIGGSVAETGLETIGIAESIDVGNFDRSETAIVLLDSLSARRGPNSLNSISRVARIPMTELVGSTLGTIAAHEAGHFLGNWHTDPDNEVIEVMDAGGNISNFVGVGRDGRFGTRDDIDVDFAPDQFFPSEGFSGRSDPVARTAFALSTGRLPVPVTCTLTGTDGPDRLRGTPGNDVICGLGGDDILLGRGGRDRLIGGPGNDRLLGGRGEDLLLGGPGRDVGNGGAGADRCRTERRINC